LDDKIVAVGLGLIASVFMTVLWEEWAVWSLNKKPQGLNYFSAALRANVYTQLVVLTILAILILPKRLKSPDFLAKLLGQHPIEQKSNLSSTATVKINH